MALVKKFEVETKDSTGKKHSQIFNINVDSAGMFKGVCPSDLLLHVQNAAASVREKISPVILRPKKRTSSPGDHDIFYIEANNMAAIEATLTEAMRLKMFQEETTETIIAVEFSGYFNTKRNKADGRLLPSLRAVEMLPENKDRASSDYWKEWENANRADDYGWGHEQRGGFRLSIGANVYLKATVTSGEHRKISYNRIDGNGDKTDQARFDRLGPFGKLLTEMTLTPFDDTRHDNSRSGVPSIEIPYTEEAAQFFYELIMNMARLGQKMQEFIGNAEAIQQSVCAFAAGHGPLGLPAPAPAPIVMPRRDEAHDIQSAEGDGE